MKSIKNIIWLFFPLFFACTEVIDLKFSTDFERLVVDASITDQDTLQFVNLSIINLDANDTVVSPISNASVIVNNGDLDIVFLESDKRKGLYIAPDDFVGEVDKTYELKISNVGVLGTDGTTNYESKVTMASAIKMDSVTTEYAYRPQFGMIGFVLKCWAWDPPEKNYYLFKAWRNGVMLTDTLFEYEQTDDVIFNGNYIYGVECQLLKDWKTDEYVVDGDTLALEIDNIDEGYFNYLMSAQSEYRGSNPLFGGPPANVTSNISNGAVGVFRVYTVSKGIVVVHEADRSENPKEEK